MNKREAKRLAHAWVAGVIYGALGNGDGDDFGVDNEDDYQRIFAAIEEIRFGHERAAEEARHAA